MSKSQFEMTDEVFTTHVIPLKYSEKDLTRQLDEFRDDVSELFSATAKAGRKVVSIFFTELSNEPKRANHDIPYLVAVSEYTNEPTNTPPRYEVHAVATEEKERFVQSVRKPDAFMSDISDVYNRVVKAGGKVIETFSAELLASIEAGHPTSMNHRFFVAELPYVEVKSTS